MKTLTAKRNADFINGLGETLTQRLARETSVAANGCWLWTGHRHAQGYGHVKWNGRMQLAHRLAMEATGLDLGEMKACHRCDNPPCINPAHLFAGTQADNVRDRDAKGRVSRKSVNIGEACANAKLGRVAVECLRAVHALGLFTERELAKWWGVSQQNVNAIVHRRSWRHV